MIYEVDPRDEEYPAHQLRPLKGGRYKDIIHGPPGTDIGDLYTDREPYVEGDRPAVCTHSGWKLTEEQLAYLKDGGHIRLAVFQHPIPPLAVSVEPPVCHCHEQAMNWSPDEGFFCSQTKVADGQRDDPEAEAKKAERDVREGFSSANEDSPSDESGTTPPG